MAKIGGGEKAKQNLRGAQHREGEEKKKCEIKSHEKYLIETVLE